MDNEQTKTNVGWRIRIAAVLVVILVALLGLEVLAWVAFVSREELRDIASKMNAEPGLQLDPYEIKDESVPGHWRLRPGYGATTDELIKAKNDAGKWLGSEAIRRTKSAASKTLTINADGFKGPPLDPAHRCPRMLVLGDSVTFGLGTTSYPLFMQRSFKQLGIGVEVVNGGVEGYAPRNLIIEMPRYQALKPDIIVVYIGWNALFSPDMLAGTATQWRWIKTPWLISRVSHVLSLLLHDETDIATKSFNKSLNPDPQSSEIKQLRGHSLYFKDDLLELVSKLRAVAPDVYLVSLFGLFQADQKPSFAAMEIGHLPAWTDNPYGLATVTDLTNDILRDLTKQSGVHYVDLQTWGRKALHPPENFFFDSVHFDLEGLRQVGAFMAKALAPDIKAHKQFCDIKG